MSTISYDVERLLTKILGEKFAPMRDSELKDQSKIGVYTLT
jgi:hypothetical protein